MGADESAARPPRWPRLAGAWPALPGAEQRTKPAELELHQRHQDGDAHDPAYDEPGDPGVTIGDGGQQTSREAGQTAVTTPTIPATVRNACQ